MNTHCLWLIAVAIAVGIFARDTLAASLSPLQESGREIYRKGQSVGEPQITAVLGEWDVVLSSRQIACVNCHGAAGIGAKEGGVNVPPIDRLTLARRLYDDAKLKRAITGGVSASGDTLHVAMPRYRVTKAQIAALLAYLELLGGEQDTDPGLTATTIKIGAALPLSGPFAAVGEGLRATLAAYFGELNAAGGVYGRKFELVSADSRGDPAATLDATRRLIETDKVFALVANFDPGNSLAVDELIERGEVPAIGPVSLSARATNNVYTYYLLPSFNDQARTLVDFVATQAVRSGRMNIDAAQGNRSKTARIGVIYAETAEDKEALTGLREQARLHGIEIALEQSYDSGGFSGALAMRLLAERKPDYVFFFGAPGDCKALAVAMDAANWRAPLLTLMAMLGRTAFELPPQVSEQLRLASPMRAPNGDDFTELDALLRRSGGALRNPAFQSIAFAAAKVLVEAVKQSGRELSRAMLLQKLDLLYEFKTGVLPPLTFAANRKIGAAGSYIIGVDALNLRYVPLSGCLAPRTEDGSLKSED